MSGDGYSFLVPPGSNFVGAGAYMPVATLLSAYPPAAAYVGNYARVNDLWGSVSTVMICETDGATYYWRPQRTDYAINNTSTGGTVSLVPLVSAPIHYFTASLVGNVTVAPSATNAWPGAQFTIVSKGTLGLFGINVNGLIGGGTLSLLTGNSRTMTYTSSGWQGS